MSFTSLFSGPVAFSLPTPLFVFAGLPLATLLGLFAIFGLLTLGLYLLKLRRRRVEVPFLPLWESFLVERKASALRSQLQRLFSLILSLLLVLALVLALGDPREERQSEGGRSLLVLIDVSASMGQKEGDRTRLALAKERAEQWFSSLGQGDRLLLVELGARPRPVEAFTSEKQRLIDAISGLRVLDVSADLEAGLRLARDALRGLPNPEIILVSDGAHEPLHGDFSDLPKLSYEPVAKTQKEQEGNLSVTGFSARRYPTAQDRFEVLVQIESLGMKDAAVELSIHAARPDGKKGPLLDVQSLSLADGETIFRTYDDLDHAEEGLIAEVRRVDGKEEAFLADNVARTLLAPLKPLRVLVVGGANNFLEAALLIDETLIVERVSAPQYPAQGSFDLTIFDGVFPKRDSATGPALYLGVPKEGDDYPVELGKDLSLFGFDTWKKDSGVFRSIDPYNVQVLSGQALKPIEGDLVLAKSGNDPIMVSGQRSNGSFIALGFDPTKSDFVMRAVWPLFVSNVLEEMSPRRAGDTLLGLRTGTFVRAMAPVDHGRALVRGPFTGGGPVGELSTLVDEGRVSFFGQEAGFYDVVSDGQQSRFSASLLSAAESRLLPREELEIAGKKAGAVTGMEPRKEREPWVWLLLGVGVISFIEWWTYHRRWTL